MGSARVPYVSAKLQGFGTTIFAEMSALAIAKGAVNLGQGFPDYEGPAVVLEAAKAAIDGGLNQYPPGPGIPALRQALAASIIGLCDTGDEVVMLEPSYDSYSAVVAMAGAIPKYVTLRPPHYDLDLDALRKAITPKTRLLLINTPHNPTGKVLTQAEMQGIADLAIEHDLIVVSDEVYEHLVFDGVKHICMAEIPGMRERTLVLSSGGKTFNTTGWKVGWVCAPPHLIAAVRTAKQFLTYVAGGPFQAGIAAGLRLPDEYYREIADDLQIKRDRICAGLEEAGFLTYKPSGTYFVTVDIRPVRPDGDGFAFCRELPDRCGVVAIPNVVFYANKDEGRHMVRFAFCKRHEVIDDATTRLKALTR